MFVKPNKTKKSTPNDIVMTNEITAKKIINYFNPQGFILEPCKGTGNFYNNMNNPKDYCEISEGIDFLQYNKKVDWIITNPPFSIFDIFLLKAFDVANNIVFFCPLNKVFKSKKIDKAIQNYGGIAEVINMGTGGQHGFPFGFPVGCIYYKKNYNGHIKYTRIYE